MNVIKTESVNTNNAWGFGGKSGVYTYYDNGLVHFKGSCSFRHLPNEKIDNWYVNQEFNDYPLTPLNKSKKPKQGDVISVFGEHCFAYINNFDQDVLSWRDKDYKRIKRIVI